MVILLYGGLNMYYNTDRYNSFVILDMVLQYAFNPLTTTLVTFIHCPKYQKWLYKNCYYYCTLIYFLDQILWTVTIYPSWMAVLYSKLWIGGCICKTLRLKIFTCSGWWISILVVICGWKTFFGLKSISLELNPRFSSHGTRSHISWQC